MRSDSSTGTPLAARMASVRMKRAVLSPRVSRPTSGRRSFSACQRRLGPGLESMMRTPTMAATTAAAMSHHQACTNSLIPISARVSPGNSLPH